MTNNRILTPADRQAHIDKCRRLDKESQWGEVQNPLHYKALGDIASVNDNRWHNPVTGFDEFYFDTPEWVVQIAVERKFISKVGVHPYDR